jgi:hypothetical protein
MTLVPKELLDQDELWALLFVVGVVLLNWPVLSIAARGASLWGIPNILVYLTGVWLLIIFFAYLREWGRSD